MRMMKRGEKGKRCLLVLTGAFKLGGGIAAANRLVIQALQDDGWHVGTLALNEVLLPSHNSNINIQTQSFGNNKVAFVLAVWRMLLTQRYAFVFCDHVNLAAMLLPVRHLSRIPVIVRLNGIEVFPPLPSLEGRLGIHASTHLTAISDFTSRQMKRQFPHREITTVDLSLEPGIAPIEDVYADTRVQLEMTSIDGIQRQLGHSMLLLVGRMAATERYKGQDTLILAMKTIATVHPNVQLVLVGQGDDRERLVKLAMVQPEDIRARIFMPGFVEDALLQQLYKHCYLFTMPSQGEGFGLVYLEAMRWEKACLGSRVDAAASVIKDGETGILVNDPTNPEAVARALISLLENPELVHKMGLAASLSVADHFTYERFRSRFISFVNTVVLAKPSKYKV